MPPRKPKLTKQHPANHTNTIYGVSYCRVSTSNQLKDTRAESKMMPLLKFNANDVKIISSF
ncbi:MAG: hypothetical protein HQK52_17835 [Oligoflexia bacterium]|nr:hypothetical protein [Oligoflexia bacterium]